MVCPQEEANQNALDRMVQFPSETKLDAFAGNHRADLADSLSSDSRNLWVRIHPSLSRQSKLGCCDSVCHQSCSQFDLHADPVWIAKPSAGSVRHLDYLGNDHLVCYRYLAALQVGFFRPSALLYLGVAGDRTATEYHCDELG